MRGLISPNACQILSFKNFNLPTGCSVQFSHSVMSNSLQTHGLRHTRIPCPLPTLGACSNSCTLSWWYRPTISSFVVPFSSCLQSFPASGSFPMNQFFASAGQSIGTSALASVLPVNIQGSFPSGLTGLISLQSLDVVIKLIFIFLQNCQQNFYSPLTLYH